MKIILKLQNFTRLEKVMDIIRDLSTIYSLLPSFRTVVRWLPSNHQMVILSSWQFYALYRNFRDLYEAYTWVASGVGLLRSFVGFLKPIIWSGPPSTVKDDFIVVDVNGMQITCSKAANPRLRSKSL